ncbi:hypothetical protein [Janthinobacterium sp. 1_2014MBL_MicDiv]|uniref:hypothetical protein n=1 Tax=Janthinobacterium sp. 1_2014MBL_MicDiv TaxID=1644131 RepID=UPI0008F500B0|nr:hypothetical protein [Janthinobacterium sp. 1_2014MBL_MicDiv]APA70975.1 hypothetical protein YQ44_27675 [Janthinobacterium sp. 1_2014MBL_MicDiv]
MMAWTASSPVLQVEHLDFHFPTRSVFQGCRQPFGAGVTWLRGAHGAGKTTLPKLAGGALLPAREI